MAIRRARRHLDIWPGFVDALSSLLMVIIFLLMVFVLAQFVLSQALTGRDAALAQLTRQLSDMAEQLSLEKMGAEDLRRQMVSLSSELKSSLAAKDKLGADLAAALAGRDKLAADLMRMTDRANGAADESTKLRAQLVEATKVIDADRETVKAQLAELANLRRDIEILQSVRQNLEADLLAARDHANKGEQSSAQVELLNRQIAALREQMAALGKTLDVSEAKSREQEVQIADLGRRLNLALAAKVEELQQYRSEFYGKLRQSLGNGNQNIRVIGDRFVFQSEVLFDSGSAALGQEGQKQLVQLAHALQDLAKTIPKDMPWVLRVDGHTDRRPMHGGFQSNWELSTARALTVVHFLIAQGIAPDRLAPTGFGEFHPLEPGEDEAAWRRNRRIEMRLTER